MQFLQYVSSILFKPHPPSSRVTLSSLVENGKEDTARPPPRSPLPLLDSSITTTFLSCGNHWSTINTLREANQIAEIRRKKVELSQAVKRVILVHGLDPTIPQTKVKTIFTDQKTYFQIRVFGYELDHCNLFVESVGPGPVSLGYRVERVVKSKEGLIIIYFGFRVSKAGDYLIYFRYLDVPLDESPFLLKVLELQNTDPKKVIAAKRVIGIGRGLCRFPCGEEVGFKVDTRGVRPTAGVRPCGNEFQHNPPLVVIIDCPNGKTLNPTGRIHSAFGTEIKYQTEIKGTHWVSVKWDGAHILGSPFQVKVEARRRHAYDDYGLELSEGTRLLLDGRERRDRKLVGSIILKEDYAKLIDI